MNEEKSTEVLQNITQNNKNNFKATISPLTLNEKLGEIALLPISVGMEYHEGEKLSATVDAIIEAGYKFCHILVGDKLQRHTLMMDDPLLTETEAERQSIESGGRWLIRNSAIFEKFKENNVEVKIIRWDEMLSSSEYERHFKIVNSTNKRYADYADYVELAATTFLSNRVKTRLKTRLKQSRRKNIAVNVGKEENEMRVKLCSQYINEEAIVLRMLASNDRNEYYSFIYPMKGHYVSETVMTALKNTLDNDSNVGFFDLKISRKKEPRKQKRLKNMPRETTPTFSFNTHSIFTPPDNSNQDQNSSGVLRGTLGSGVIDPQFSLNTHSIFTPPDNSNQNQAFLNVIRNILRLELIDPQYRIAVVDLLLVSVLESKAYNTSSLTDYNKQSNNSNISFNNG